MVVEIRNQRWQVRAAYGDRGFIITSLYDLYYQKEWLYTEKDFSCERSLDKGFDEQYQGGMEFLFPSDEEEIFEDRVYKDHGELWRLPYQIRKNNDTICACSISKKEELCVCYEIKLTDSAVRVRLEVQNKGLEELSYLARLHPAFLMDKETRLELHMTEAVFEPGGAYCSFSPDEIDRQEMDVERPATWKQHDWFVHLKQHIGEFTIRQGERSLRVQYCHERLPFLTLCSFFLKGKRIGILEPANVLGVSLNSAGKRTEIPVLKHGEKAEFIFTIIPS